MAGFPSRSPWGQAVPDGFEEFGPSGILAWLARPGRGQVNRIEELVSRQAADLVAAPQECVNQVGDAAVNGIWEMCRYHGCQSPGVGIWHLELQAATQEGRGEDLLAVTADYHDRESVTSHDATPDDRNPPWIECVDGLFWFCRARPHELRDGELTILEYVEQVIRQINITLV
jgi:hypothetical protein